MPQAQCQGIINVPLFLSPYELGVTDAGTVFTRRSDVAAITPWYRTQTKSPNNWAGMWYDISIMNPFTLTRFTNDPTRIMGSFNGDGDEIYISANGNIYMSAIGQTAISNQVFTFAYFPWVYGNALTRKTILANDGVSWGNYRVGSPSMAGLCNLQSVPNVRNAICLHQYSFPNSYVSVAIPEIGASFGNWPFTIPSWPIGTFLSNEVFCSPDADGLYTHFVFGCTPNGGSIASMMYSKCVVSNIALSAQATTFEKVTIDNGIDANIQTAFNSTSAYNLGDIRRAPRGWLIGKITSASPIKHILMSQNCTQYWGLNFVPITIPLSATFTNSSITSATIDFTGVAYVQSNAFNRSGFGAVGNSYAFNLPWYPIAVPQVPAFQLPCPPPCENVKSDL